MFAPADLAVLVGVHFVESAFGAALHDHGQTGLEFRQSHEAVAIAVLFGEGLGPGSVEFAPADHPVPVGIGFGKSLPAKAGRRRIGRQERIGLHVVAF